MQEISRLVDRLAANTQPVFYVNRPATHLIGVERWIPSFYSIRLRDLWPSDDPRVFTPSKTPAGALSHEDSVLWLLRNDEVQRFIREHTPKGMRPKVIGYFMHEESTERLCAELGYDLMALPVAERKRLDSKLLTTRLSEEAGLKNVPHVVTTVDSWTDLQQVADTANLGGELVLQTDYGEAGTGTFFVRNETDFNRDAEYLTGVPLKVMKRVNHRSLAMDAVVTESGIIAGPLLQDIIGHSEVAIHKGASSGLEYYPDVLPPDERRRATNMVIRYGEILKAQGYLGLYEVDVLHDLDTGELHFGEMNPRFSGCAMVTNATTAEYWGLPLYAIHIAAHLGLTKDLNVTRINDSWDFVPEDLAWANILLRQVDETKEEIVTAPSSGSYRSGPSGVLERYDAATDWYGLRNPGDIFYLPYRIAGDMMIHGSEFGSIYRHGRFQNYAGELTDDSRTLIHQVKALYRVKPLGFMTRTKHAIARRINRLRG